ncbi:cupin domain-containing protein [Pandoraea pulmonicola]|uniref:Cupin n=1 Tax=Pandoraea pulmonicola TaxID=93221 RepID=A0AAJ5CZ28_PANPU|nr:cupin domain-containing protein [Pandoraea pulmonicola]AJC21895.1 cupin [Pandoraea pulmonicola]SUA89168.1 Cupin superfamily protein [Pandoraea pulmonicola]
MTTSRTPSPLLGGLAPDAFMKRYWHKRPLLIRQAIPGFTAPLSREALFALAAQDDVESRLISHTRKRWQLEHGPFDADDLPPLSRKQWTLLVQGVNLHAPAVDALMQQFRFVPDARLDDVMISYATDGGGVGPHLDSYDVFLLQAHGKRRWRIGPQRDTTWLEGVPLRILKHFEAEQEWVLEPGDMLYLPPGYAHDGVAEGECMTYSIGFRAPLEQEMLQNFLYYLAENAAALPFARHFAGRYADPGQTAVKHPASLPDAMIGTLVSQLEKVRWGQKEVEDFLGRWLSEPKSHVFFEAPDSPVSLSKFARLAASNGLALSPKTQLLYRRNRYFANGEPLEVPVNARSTIRSLADQRRLNAVECANFGQKDQEIVEILYDWYASGWLLIGPDPMPVRKLRTVRKKAG